MKRLVIVGMLIALAIAPVATAFAEQGEPQLHPSMKEEISPEVAPQAFILWREFFMLGLNTGRFSYILVVSNYTDINGQLIRIQTRTLGGSNFTRTDPYLPRQTRFFTAQETSCPVGDVCFLRLDAAIPPPGNICFIMFDSLLVVLDITQGGEIAAILQPSFPACESN
jgi:hypothetical protein